MQKRKCRIRRFPWRMQFLCCLWLGAPSRRRSGSRLLQRRPRGRPTKHHAEGREGERGRAAAGRRAGSEHGFPSADSSSPPTASPAPLRRTASRMTSIGHFSARCEGGALWFLGEHPHRQEHVTAYGVGFTSAIAENLSCGLFRELRMSSENRRWRGALDRALDDRRECV